MQRQPTFIARRLAAVAGLLFLLLPGMEDLLAATASNVLYQSDFANAALGELPSGFLAVNGEFALREEGGQRFLELPGAPLDTFQVLFGPNEKTNVAASVRVWGSKRGRQFPTFAVGLNGSAGFRVQVSPAKNSVELFRGDDVLASKPFAWESDQWTSLRLEVVQTGGGEWTVRGKAWKDGAPEPAEWLVSAVEKTEPRSGRASLWGSPYSGNPIRFDSLKVVRSADKP